MSQVREYGNIRSEYASYSAMSELNAEVQKTANAVRAKRAKVAPAEDLNLERRAISKELQRSMFFAQLALALVVASLVAYLILPTDWAHGITFLLFCTGVAVGFFLRK